MTLYTIRFCGKEFVAYNLRDFARIAVFAKWYLRMQSSSAPLECSVKQQDETTLEMPTNPMSVAIKRRFNSATQFAVRSFLQKVV
jgi:hypothetical protein